MSAEELQRVFKTFADPTRVRLLALLEREELAVQELMDVLGMAQSRVSRHLAILREAGLIRDRRDGTFVFYRFAVPAEGPWRDAWELVGRGLAEDATAGRDATALARVMEARAARTRSFFDAVGPEWDALRKVFNDDALRARGVTRLLEPGLVVADVGTGTGILALELARLGLRVVAVDHSSRMLDAVRTKLAEGAVEGVELRQGDAGALPIEDGEVDAAIAHMVLHYLPSPAEAIREMARVVKPGGAVVVVDFVAHEHEWMRQELGVAWLGFPEEEVRSWFADTDLGDFRLEILDPLPAARDLPGTFIASGRRPR
ncbi:MAG: metalloregulator ArsR/SmtB family transcription factor [Myxococcota bacterium]|nr:metalloregulator ArsR/SmtB family transcription factor [Myxococcota bacterium]